MREGDRVATDLSDACLLWDIDGILVLNAHPKRDRHSHAVRRVIEVDAQPAQFGTGKTDREIIAEIVSAHREPDDEVLDAALDALDEITEEDLASVPSIAVAGVAEVLQALASTPLQQRLLTGNTPRRAELKITTVGLDQHFSGSSGFTGDRHLTRYALVAEAVEPPSALGALNRVSACRGRRDDGVAGSFGSGCSSGCAGAGAESRIPGLC